MDTSESQHSPDSDYAKLVKFLTDLSQIFTKIIESKEQLLPVELHKKFEDSWHNVIKDEIISLQKQINSDQFKNNKNFMRNLKLVGLVDALLELKLAVFDLIYDKFKLLAKKSTNTAFKLLKNLLESGNVILSSLGIVVIQAHGIKEFKDALEAAINVKEDLDSLRDPIYER